MKSKCLVLFSGGIDSTVVCEQLKPVYDITCIGFDYGQPHKIELSYAKDYCTKNNLEFVTQKLSKLQKSDSIVFKGRNNLFLSHAIVYALGNDISCIATGINKDDKKDFPDCRDLYLQSAEGMCETYGLSYLHPLSNLSKKEVIKMLENYNLSINSTWTCYNPVGNAPCGICYSCRGLV